jgi:hypothetical protein
VRSELVICLVGFFYLTGSVDLDGGFFLVAWLLQDSLLSRLYTALNNLPGAVYLNQERTGSQVTSIFHLHAQYQVYGCVATRANRLGFYGDRNDCQVRQGGAGLDYDLCRRWGRGGHPAGAR